MNKSIIAAIYLISSVLFSSAVSADSMCFSSNTAFEGLTSCTVIEPDQERMTITNLQVTSANFQAAGVSAVAVQPDAVLGTSNSYDNGLLDLVIILYSGDDFTGDYRVFYTSEGDFSNNGGVLNLADPSIGFDDLSRSAIIVNRSFAPVFEGLY